MLKISIILTTRNRPDGLRSALDSIGQQNYAEDFETIVNDQSDIIASIAPPAQGRFTQLEDSQRGLSRGRNHAARKAQGQYLLFIDDDAILEPDCLTQITALLNEHKTHCLCGVILNIEDRKPFGRYQRKDQHGVVIHGYNLDRCLGSAFVIEKSVLEKVGWFDERFGSGRYYGASEESDLVLRLLDAGYSVIYDARFIVLHPRTDPYAMDLQPWLSKHYHYGLGRGALLRKRLWQNPVWTILWLLYSLLIPLAAAVVSLLLFRPRQAGRYAISATGRTVGFIRFPSSAD